MALQTFAETKVSQLDAAIVQHDIWRFKIAVHDVVGSKDAKGIDQLLQIANHFTLWEKSLAADLLVESSSIAELVKKVEIIDCFKYLDKTHNVRTVDPCEDLDFI